MLDLIIRQKYKANKMSFWDEKEAKGSFKNFHLSWTLEKPYIKLLNDIDTLHELPAYNELGMVKTSKAFK